MNIEEAKELLQSGEAVKRPHMPSGSYIFMQVPTCIPNEVVGRMTSVPEPVKKLLLETAERMNLTALNYHNQLALVNEHNEITTYQFTTKYIWASDWIHIKAVTNEQ